MSKFKITHPDLPGQTFDSEEEANEALENLAFERALVAALATTDEFVDKNAVVRLARKVMPALIAMIDSDALNMGSDDQLNAYASDATGRAIPFKGRQKRKGKTEGTEETNGDLTVTEGAEGKVEEVSNDAPTGTSPAPAPAPKPAAKKTAAKA